MRIRATLLFVAVPLLLAADKPEWFKFAPKDEKFKMLLPKEPRDLSPKSSPDAPVRSKVYLCQPANAGEAAYTVNVTEMAGKVTPEEVPDGILTSLKGKLKSQNPFASATPTGRHSTTTPPTQNP